MCPENFRIFFIMFVCANSLRCESKHNVTRHKTKNSRNSIQGKIVNGKTVPIEEYPFAVQFLNKGSMCGGVIIHSWAVLTAAHCLAFNTDAEEMMIRTGAKYAYDFNSDRYNVLSFVIHEDYNKEQVFSCDIALVFPEKPIKFGTRSQKGIIVNHDKWMDEGKGNFVVTGWGYTQEGGSVSKVGLQMTSLKYVPPKECSKLYDNYKFTADMFCLYGDGKSDACRGDSGGGVLWNDLLVGLTSHGNGCARKDRPSVYTNLWILRNWIKENLLEFYENYCNNKFRAGGKFIEKSDIDSMELFV